MDLINILLIVAVGVTLFFGFSIFFHRNEGEKFAFSFFLLSLTMSAWSASEVLMRLASEQDVLVVARIDYAIAVFIPIFFLHFVLEFTDYRFWRSYKTAIRAFLSVLGITAFVITVTTNFVITSVVPNQVTENIIYFGTPYIWYIVYYLILFPLAFALLGHNYLTSQSEKKRNQLFVIFVGTLVNASFGLTTDLIMPWLGNNVTGWFANFTSIFFMGSILYGMVQYKLFSFKIIATELFAVTIWSILAVELFLTDSAFLFAVRAVIFVAIVLLSIFLIKSTYREVEQKEQIQALYEELEDKNKKLTELDKLKSQFLSIATHELRTPLTIVRNFVALILDGSYGKVPPAVEEGGRQVFERVTDMAHSVDTYLNVSRIEQGKIKYDFTPEDLTKLVTTAFAGMKANAEKKGLALSLTIGKGAETMRGAFDAPKITEVLINLIDNSIKYTPKGSITATLEKSGPQRARLTIKDTGVGMSQKTQQNLFKLFSPGEDSKKINPASTGVGLYISRAHAEAHKGTLTASSAGEGKGSQFVLELPIS